MKIVITTIIAENVCVCVFVCESGGLRSDDQSLGRPLNLNCFYNSGYSWVNANNYYCICTYVCTYVHCLVHCNSYQWCTKRI